MEIKMEENKVKATPQEKAQAKVDIVIAELSLNKKNTHITGRGGDEDIFLALCDKNNVFGDTTDIVVGETETTWNMEWVEKTSMEDIRAALDAKNLTRPDIKDLLADGEKLCLAMKDKFGSTSINDLLTGNMASIEKASKIDQFLLFSAICKTLAMKLEENKTNTSFVEEYAKNIVMAAKYVSAPMIAAAVRNQIGLQKIVEFSLDEYPDFIGFFHQLIMKVFDNK